MSIRLRNTDEGLVALCAARSIVKPGDTYLDDAAHHALTRKFVRDFESMGFLNYTPSADALDAVVEREESNNPNRVQWDKDFGDAAHPPAPAGTPPTATITENGIGEVWADFYCGQCGTGNAVPTETVREALAKLSPAGTPREPGWTEASGKVWSLIRDVMLRAIRLSEEQAPREEESAKLDALAAQCADRVLALSAVPAAGEVSEKSTPNSNDSNSNEV